MPQKTVSLSKKCILDTDHVSLILQNNSQVIANAAKHEISVTIVTVQELFNGWAGRINDPSQRHNLPALYLKLGTTLEYLQTIEVLNFTLEADICLKKLLKDYPPLRKNRLEKDMRIAAIALSIGA
ncbi:MAG: type II toxin-antitoxin system VapC family toxin, partial [Microcoleus sp.]